MNIYADIPARGIVIHMMAAYLRAIISNGGSMRHILMSAIMLMGFSTLSEAVVIRHDVEPEKYLTHEAPAAMVDMRHEGHGVLIAPEWVLTPAHVVFYDYRGKTITVGCKAREIEYVIFHPGYAKPTPGLFTGDAARSQAYLKANHDVALVKLSKPVTDVTPARLYDGKAEQGEIITFYGKGNTGNGRIGEQDKTKGTLRKAQNRISAAEDQWISYRFDHGADSLPLEGVQGNGDSGGPALITQDGVTYVAGLASWDVYEGDLADFQAGIYGIGAQLVRVSYYQDWIKNVMGWSGARLAEHHHKIGQ